MSISDRLNQLIKNKDVTCYKLNEYTGISEATLGRIVKGETKKPNTNTLKILANYFNINIEWLRTGKGEMLKKDLPIAVNKNNSISIQAEGNSFSITEMLNIIKNQSESIKIKDEQMILILNSLNTRDKQLDEMLKIIKEQNKKSDAEDANFAVKREAQG